MTNHRSTLSSYKIPIAICLALVSRVPSAELLYEVQSGKTTYSPQEQVLLEARLINAGDEPVVIYWESKRFHDAAVVEVKREDGRQLVAGYGSSLPPLSALDPKYFREIPPGGRMDFTLDLNWNWPHHRYILRTPGKYVIHCAFAIHPDTPPGADTPCWTGRVDAEPLEIEISDDPSIRGDDSATGLPWVLGTTTLQGQVIDPSGMPVAGRVVHVSRRSHQSGGGYEGLLDLEIERVRSDAEGRFVFEQLPDDSSFFILSCVGLDGRMIKKVVAADPPNRQLSVLLRPPLPDPEHTPIAIRGLVQDALGQPIAGVKVSAPIRQGLPVEEHYTDEKGYFRLRTIPHDDRIRLGANKPGYARHRYTVPLEEAEAGPIVLTLKTVDEMKAKGRIRFLSGRATKGLSGKFSLKDRQGEYVGASSLNISEDGRFEVVLNREASLSGKARFSIGYVNSSGAQPRWWTEVSGLAPGIEDTEIVINDSGSIEVDVKTLDAQEEIGPIKVRLELLDASLGDRYEPIDVQELEPEGGIALFEGLCPGDYRVQVNVPIFTYWSWEKKISLAAGDGRLRRTVLFPLPKMGLGAVRGRIAGEDGVVPRVVDLAEVRPSADSRAKRNLRHNSEGEFFADEILSGRFWLTLRAEGYEEWRSAGMIEPGKTADLGLITLKRRTLPGPGDGYGMATGRLLYDDGTPVLGVYNSGWAHQATTDAQGAFQVKLGAGQSLVEFNLTNTSIWPGAYHARDGGSYGAYVQHRVSDVNMSGYWSQYSLVADYFIRPDETTRRDIAIPRKNLASIRLHWLDEEKASLSIGSFSTAGGLQFQRRGSFSATGKCVIDIPDLRPGSLVVTIRSDDLFGYKRFAPGETDLNAAFGPSQCGSIRGYVSKSDGEPNAEVKVYACPAGLEVPGGIRSTTGDSVPFVGHVGRKWSALAVSATDSSGYFEFPNVSPGKYALCIDEDTYTEIDVRIGEEATAKLVSDKIALRSGPPPLRETDK